MLFYTNVSGNMAEEYRRENLDSQLKSELLTALQPAFAQMCIRDRAYGATALVGIFVGYVARQLGLN